IRGLRVAARRACRRAEASGAAQAVRCVRGAAADRVEPAVPRLVVGAVPRRHHGPRRRAVRVAGGHRRTGQGQRHYPGAPAATVRVQGPARKGRLQQAAPRLRPDLRLHRRPVHAVRGHCRPGCLPGRLLFLL
ncbi:hypothetical protein H4R23_002629, partial [Coemansia sp. Cherry 401B]